MNSTYTNEELQKMILGALISSEGEIFPEVIEIIQPNQFQEIAQAVYGQIEMFFKARHPINMQMLIGTLGFEKYSEYLLSCEGSGLVTTGIFHAQELAIRLKRQRVIKSLQDIQIRAKDEFTEIDEPLEDVRNLWLKEYGKEEKKKYDIHSVSERYEKIVIENKKTGMGVETGFEWLDSRWITYRPGHILMIGGFTSSGKTALLAEMCVRLMTQNVSTAIISTEMTEEQMVSRLLANMTGFNANVILSGHLIDKHKVPVAESLEKIKKQKITIIDDVRTLAGIYQVCRKKWIQNDLRIVFLDYVQNLKLVGASRYEAMADAATFLQGMAKELKCTVVCFSQRSNQSVRDDKGMAEYKNSGELAAVADVGLMLMRHKTNKKELLVDIRKNRHGATGEFSLQFSEGFTDLKEL